MFQTVLKEYFLLDVGQYFDGVSFLINIFILSICLGICAAAVCVTVHKRYTADIIRQLLRHGACSPDKAKTLSEIHLENSFFLKSALSRNGQLTYIVKMAENEDKDIGGGVEAVESREKYRKDKIDFDTARFFISEERLDRAKTVNEEKVPNYFNTVIVCLLVMSVAFIVTLFMPDILAFIAGL
ncbi:MAG: hypothetical protein IJ515_01105 [Clostridia bacterium]|nr:hypothetical protein [Clostridia bacterium]